MTDFLQTLPTTEALAIDAAKEHVVNSVMHLRNAFGTHGEARAIRFVLEAADRLHEIENTAKDEGTSTMTQAEPCPGPYRVEERVPGWWSIIGLDGHGIVRMSDEPTARLLAASWDMRELLIELAGHYSKASDEALKQWAATDLQAGRMIRLRKLLAEIDGNDNDTK